jgi:hypothetical protein
LVLSLAPIFFLAAAVLWSNSFASRFIDSAHHAIFSLPSPGRRSSDVVPVENASCLVAPNGYCIFLGSTIADHIFSSGWPEVIMGINQQIRQQSHDETQIANV